MTFVARLFAALALLLAAPLAAQDSAPASPETETVPETVAVVLETTLGEIHIALEAERAPITAGNFLRYVDEGRFDGTVFYRAMHLDWEPQPNGLIQGGAQWDPERVLPGIAHEPTTLTGLSHTRGALSMAMGEPGTANGDFSIMVQDQLGMDADPGAENPVWQAGYAVFGYVTEGMEVVEAIHAAPIDPEKGEGWMKGEMLAEPVEIVRARRAPPEGSFSEDQALLVPIIVTGEDEEEQSAQSGSRISSKPRFTDLTYASSTGLAGSPGGGFEPFNLQNPTRRKIVKSCRSEDDRLGIEATCLIAASDEAMARGDVGEARDLLRYVSGSEEFTSFERLEGAKRIFAIGKQISDKSLEEEALLRMLATKAMQEAQAQSARRALVRLALARNDQPAAIERLETVILHDAQDAQSMANLAALRDQAGLSGWRHLLERAIAIREEQGIDVPISWRDRIKNH